MAGGSGKGKKGIMRGQGRPSGEIQAHVNEQER